ADIDCPELAQPYGKEAQQFVAGLVLNKDVSVEGIGVDGHKRTLGVVTLGDGRVLNRELVSAGLAWFYDQHPNVDPTLPGLMAAARAAKKGLWADAAPLAPWDFRGDALKERAAKTVEVASDSSELPIGGAVFIDKDGKEFHKLSCVLLDKASRHSVMLQDVQAQGYSPCRKCFPLKSKVSTPVVAAKGNLGDVPKEEFPKPTAAPASPPPQAAPKPVSSAAGQVQLPSDIAKYMNDPMVQGLGLTPYQDANGNFAGIAAKNISSFLPAALLGFQDGDVLHSVNGDPIDSPDKISSLIEKYKNTRSFQIGIIRNGQPQTMNVNIPDFIK
ncbi:MAG: thermonuclease family protein, partial [Candidatus Hydrogenedentes bacterium]|nr:thermonuclease family protein [Candidatus Hydrogenedentota bacterium]